jgi:hypothetical protein
MEGAIDAALENGRDALDSVRRYIVADEFRSAMIDRFVSEADQTTVSRKFVSVQCRSGFDVQANFIGRRGIFPIYKKEGRSFAALRGFRETE